MNSDHNIRRSVVRLFLGVALLCAGFRVLSGGATFSPVGQLVLAAAILAALAIVALAALKDRFSVAASGLAAGGYALVRLTLVADPSPAVLPIEIAAALEAALLLGVAWLTRRLIHDVRRLEESSLLLALPEFSQLMEQMRPNQVSADKQFQIALRHGRTISAVVLETGPGLLDFGPGPSLTRGLERRILRLHALGRLAKLVVESVRQTDIAMKAEGSRKLILLCPETASEGAVRMAEKICAAAEEKLGQSMGYGVASFPGEALNLEELVHRADSKVAARAMVERGGRSNASPETWDHARQSSGR